MIENGVAKDYYESRETGAAKVNLKVQLPPDMVCDHCVFQWWYKTGNIYISMVHVDRCCVYDSKHYCRILNNIV